MSWTHLNLFQDTFTRMNETSRGKRFFAATVAALTILWSVGAAAIAPVAAHAASTGSVIRGTTLATLYYYASNGKRYAFPNEKTYKTWYSDFSGVQTVSDSELAAIPLAGNVAYRPGSRWIKIQSDPKTYAVGPNGQIYWIESESVATGLAGSDWNGMIDDVADVFFLDYTVGASLTSAANAHNGALLSMGGNTYQIWGSQKRMVSSAGFTANRYQTRSILDGSGMTLGSLTAGAEVSSKECALSDAAQVCEAVATGFSVSLASDTPASVTIPGGADAVPFAKYKLMSTTGTTTVSSVTLTLSGVGATSNFDSVYLYAGDTRLTEGRTINSSTRKVTFGGLNLSVGSTPTYLTVRADTATAAAGGDTASFSITASGDLSSTGSVSGNFPLSGNTMSFSSQDAGEITIDKNGTVTNPSLGQENAVIAKFTVEASSSEDASVKQITLNVDDAADHSNYKIWKGSTMLATGTRVGDLVTFVFSPALAVEEGDTENLQVSADIGGQTDDEIAVAIEESGDVIATGSDFGFNLSVDITGYDDDGSTCTNGNSDCSWSEIEGGDITFAFNGPSSDEIQVDGDRQVLMKFSITSEQYASIEEIPVILTAVGGDNDDDAEHLLNGDEDVANVQNIAIRRADGSIWMGPEELDLGGNDATQTLTFTDDQILNAGETIDLMVTVDVDNAATEGDIFRATLDMSGVSVEDIDGDAVTDVVPSADLVGNEFTLEDSSLEVSVSQPPVSATYVKGSNNVPVVAFAFEAGDASVVTVTDLTLNGDADTTVAGAVASTEALDDYVTSCSLYDTLTGGLVDGPESFDDNEEALFDDFSWTVPAGETKKLTVKCNFANVDVADGHNDEYNFFIDEDLIGVDVQAEDEDGDDVNPTENGLNETVEVVVIEISDAGTLTTSLAGDSPDEKIILGSSTGVVVSKFLFEADDEAFTVKELTLEDPNENDEVAAAVRISYQNAAGQTVTRSSVLSGSSVNFSNLDFYIPSNGERTLTAMIDTGEVSATGAASGSAFSLDLDDTAGGFEAVGSSETLDGGDITAVTADVHIARQTQPTLSLASNSPSTGTPGTPGFSPVLRFNVAADSKGYIDFNGVTFKLSTTADSSEFNFCDNLTAADFSLYDAADQSTALEADNNDWDIYDNGADNDCEAGEVATYAILNLTTDERIGAGTTKSFVLKIDTTGASTIDDDSIRVDILTEDELEDVDADYNAILWDDAGEATDVDGDLVLGLPIYGNSIQY